MPIFQEARGRLDAFVARPHGRYAIAALFVALTIALRAALDPLFGDAAYYHLYYPAVILAAYLLGAGPGVFAVGFSAFAAYWAFAAPAFSFKTDPNAYVPLATFLISSSVAVFVLTHVRRRLDRLTSEYARIDALTLSQADLFREHAQRVSNNLQLVSALLQLQSREEGDATMSRVLMNAASRTLLISRMHRDFVGAESIDFQAFAVRLVEAVLAARGRPPLAVSVAGERLALPLETASALGLILVECMSARLAAEPRGAMRIELAGNPESATFRIVEDRPRAEPRRDAVLLSAIAEQMGASLVLESDKAGAALQLAFSPKLKPLPEWDPLERVH